MLRRALILPVVLCLLAAIACADSQPQAQQAVSAQPQTVTVYITKSGQKYHRDGCSSLQHSKIAISLDEAKRKGYEPCKNCRPPA